MNFHWLSGRKGTSLRLMTVGPQEMLHAPVDRVINRHSGAGLDTLILFFFFFCTVKSLGTAVGAFKKICEPLNISTSVVGTELSERL